MPTANARPNAEKDDLVPTLENIASNLAAVRDRIADAAARAGRRPEDVRLVAVTKTVDIEEIRALIALGVTDLGENRVDQARIKIAELEKYRPCWHMIGTVQRRKARDVAALFDTVDAVDRLELADALQQRCMEQDRRLRVLIEVNVSGESQKHGFAPDAIEAALEHISGLDRLRVEGLMTMAPFGAPEVVLRGVFGGLRALADRFALPERSMGMSDDFETAIEEGATQVRIGTALFI
ncbi:MAG TPA: YggS family pyridoxal phosphate-dependent enzyme [Candidatus Hydrogenedentes bacterium]|nr:YggS family pyridoxal phosphate-dependent enzyme [Candidatus Hydrogenedentota bacterium]HNT88661.1 YggS family pyridoxal phosphate-dependent enzyme [Candidatus Hydrogenedentota bacterium]